MQFIRNGIREKSNYRMVMKYSRSFIKLSHKYIVVSTRGSLEGRVMTGKKSVDEEDEEPVSKKKSTLYY